MPKVTIEDGDDKRSYEGDFVLAFVAKVTPEGFTDGRAISPGVLTVGGVAVPGLGEFLGASALMQLAADAGDASAGERFRVAARAALEVIAEIEKSQLVSAAEERRLEKENTDAAI